MSLADTSFEGIGVNASMNPPKPIELEDGWEIMGRGITKLKRILEEEPQLNFSSEEYMTLYTYPLLFLPCTCPNIQSFKIV